MAAGLSASERAPQSRCTVAMVRGARDEDSLTSSIHNMASRQQHQHPAEMR
ncbi:hypothetical protein CyaNS01_02212 [Cyanobium sp. NS01]|nr:hypothetical protein CyaNS01_02212 [Cyanobium sp. NS01]